MQSYCGVASAFPVGIVETHELSVEEQAWVEALGREAAKDEIKVTHTWFKDRGGGWRLIATIAPPRHNRSYGVPRPLSDDSGGNDSSSIGAGGSSEPGNA